MRGGWSSLADGQDVLWGWTDRAEGNDTLCAVRQDKGEVSVIGKPLVPKTRVGFKALCEFDAPFIIANI